MRAHARRLTWWTATRATRSEVPDEPWVKHVACATVLVLPFVPLIVAAEIAASTVWALFRRHRAGPSDPSGPSRPSRPTRPSRPADMPV